MQSVSRWFSMLVIVVALPSVATRALARRDGDRGGHPGRADDAQVRELLAKLAAASGEPEPEERTDADLMYEAMLRWNGEPPDSVAIDKAIEKAKTDSARTKKAIQDKVRHMFWKDPFADDGHKLVLVRQEDRDLLDAYARQKQRRPAREARDPQDEIARLRAELADARAENERMRERVDATSDRRECVADMSSGADFRRRRRGEGIHVHTRHPEKQAQIALASTTFQPPPAPAAVPAEPPPPPAHGIIVVPLPSPSPPPPPVESGRRRGVRSR